MPLPWLAQKSMKTFHKAAGAKKLDVKGRPIKTLTIMVHKKA